MRVVTKFEDGSFSVRYFENVKVWRKGDELPKFLKKYDTVDMKYVVKLGEKEIVVITPHCNIIIDDMMVDTLYMNLVNMGMYGPEALKEQTDKANGRYATPREDSTEDKVEEKPPVNEDPKA